MSHKEILRKYLCCQVGNLEICLDEEDLNFALVDMFTKVVVAHIDMLGRRVEF